MLVSVQNISKSFLDDIVLRNVSFDIQENDRIGLLGVNGAGKTTLLNLITGALEPDEGSITRSRGLEIGYLQQNDALNSSNTLEEEIQTAFAHTYNVQRQMEDCYQKLKAEPENKTLLTELDRLTARFEALDGYHLEDKINRVLNGLGFGNFDRNGSVATLSGGEKMRFGIAKMLLRQPDLLILDEPTNHLDFGMLSWLESYLEQYKGAILVVSHDRYFLDTVAKDICEIDRHQLSRYSGGYSSFIVQKAERHKVAMRAWEKQQEEIAKLEDYVRKNLARSASASNVGGRVKALEKMERLEKPPAEPKSISLRFTYDVEPFSTILDCKGLGVYVGDSISGKQLYTGVDLTVMRGEKIAVVGMNGVGKSTFLKAIQGFIPYDGRVQWGGNTRIGYFDQELAGLDMESTVIEAVHSRFPTKTEFEIRSALGRLLLEGDDVFKKVKELSGANRAKVAFAILQMQRTNVLLLDEPTNHLDYRAKEVLENALNDFTGTLLVVSHDRYFLRRVPSRILELFPGGFKSFVGNYDDYLAQKAASTADSSTEQAQRVEKAEKEQRKENTGYRSKEQRAADAQRRTRISQLEKTIEKLESSIEHAHVELASPENASDYERLASLSDQLKEDSAALDAAMEEWLALTEE